MKKTLNEIIKGLQILESSTKTDVASVIQGGNCNQIAPTFHIELHKIKKNKIQTTNTIGLLSPRFGVRFPDDAQA